ncbi:MAG: hypothetical protein ACE5GB_12205, partial [Acidimicrobiales bacterium]
MCHVVVGAVIDGRMLLLLAAGVVTAAPLVLFAAATRRLDLGVVGLMQYIAPTLQFLLGVVVSARVHQRLGATAARSRLPLVPR